MSGDHKCAGIGFYHDVLRRRIHGADSILRELGGIFARRRALRANRDSGEVRVLRRAGEAADGFFGVVEGFRLAVRSQLHVLVVVEVDHVVFHADGDGCRIVADGRVAFDRHGGFRHALLEGLAVHSLGFLHFGVRAVPVVVDGVAQVAALGVGNGFGHVLRGHRAGNGFLIHRIAGDFARSDAVLRTLHKAFHMICRRRAAIRVEVVNGEGEHVLDVVDPDDVFVHADGQPEGFGPIKSVVLGTFVGIGRNDRTVLRLRGHGQRIVLHAVDVIFDGIAVGSGLPLRVEVVATRGQASGSACGISRSAAVGRGVPAGEFIAGAGGQIQIAVTLDRNQGIDRLILALAGLIVAKVAVIGDGRLAGGRAPDGVERGIAVDLDAAALIIGGADRFLILAPAEEDHALPGQAAAAGNLRVGSLGVIVGIRNRARAAVRIVGQGIGFSVHDDGIEVNITSDLGGKVEQARAALLLRPAHKGFALSDIRNHGSKQIGGNGVALFHGFGMITLAVCGDGIVSALPACIEGDVMGRHGLARKDELEGTLFVLIPSAKGMIRLAYRRCCGRIVLTGDVLLILHVNRFILQAAVEKHDLVAVAVVVELGAIIPIAILCT